MTQRWDVYSPVNWFHKNSDSCLGTFSVCWSLKIFHWHTKRVTDFTDMKWLTGEAFYSQQPLLQLTVSQRSAGSWSQISKLLSAWTKEGKKEEFRIKRETNPILKTQNNQLESDLTVQISERKEVSQAADKLMLLL